MGRWMLGIGAVPAILQCAGLLFLPESPKHVTVFAASSEHELVISLLHRLVCRETSIEVTRIASQWKELQANKLRKRQRIPAPPQMAGIKGAGRGGAAGADAAVQRGGGCGRGAGQAGGGGRRCRSGSQPVGAPPGARGAGGAALRCYSLCLLNVDPIGHQQGKSFFLSCLNLLQRSMAALNTLIKAMQPGVACDRGCVVQGWACRCCSS